VTGANARKIIFEDAARQPATPGALWQLSADALRHVQELRLEDEAEATLRLYQFNAGALHEGMANAVAGRPIGAGVACRKAQAEVQQLFKSNWQAANARRPIRDGGSGAGVTWRRRVVGG